VIDRDVAAALCAITAITDVAACESAEELGAFMEANVFFFPQHERADRCGRITPAVFTMTVTHVQRIATHLDLHRSAVTSTCMCVCHCHCLESGNQEAKNN